MRWLEVPAPTRRLMVSGLPRTSFKQIPRGACRVRIEVRQRGGKGTAGDGGESHARRPAFAKAASSSADRRAGRDGGETRARIRTRGTNLHISKLTLSESRYSRPVMMANGAAKERRGDFQRPRERAEGAAGRVRAAGRLGAAEERR